MCKQRTKEILTLSGSSSSAQSQTIWGTKSTVKSIMLKNAWHTETTKGEKIAKQCARFVKAKTEQSFGQEAVKAFEEVEWLESKKDQRSKGY